MHGRVTQVAGRAPAHAVEAGALLVVIEAMKMEHQLRAPRAGTVGARTPGPATRCARAARRHRRSLHARPGDQVAARQCLVELQP